MLIVIPKAPAAGGVAARLTALDANDLHAWELTEASGAASFVDTGASAAKVAVPINTATNIVLGTVGQMGACPLFDFAADGTQGTGVDASILVSSFSDLPASGWTFDVWFRAWFDPSSMFLFGVSSTTGANVNISLASNNAINATVRTANSFLALSGANVAIYRNTWHHAALSYDAATVKLYLDGEVVVKGNATGNTSWTNGTTPKFSIGRDVAAGSGIAQFIGQESRLRLSNSVRSLAEIRAIYQKGNLF